MTKQNEMKANGVLVPFAAIAWIAENNMRDDYGDTKQLRESLAMRGWNPDNPIPGVIDPKSVGALTTDQIKKELAKRKRAWDSFKAEATKKDEKGEDASTPTAKTQLRVFEELYLDEKKELITPHISANAGFRRGLGAKSDEFTSTYFSAMCDRADSKDENQAKDVRKEIPVRPAFYENEAQRLIDQQEENELQGKGTKRMENLEKLKTTYRLFKVGAREVDIRRLYTDTTGQKTYAICLADQNWPNLKIYERFFKKSDHPDFIPWGPVRHDKVVNLNRRAHSMYLQANALPITKAFSGLEPISENEVDSFFRDLARNSTKGGNEIKMMEKSVIKSIAQNHPVQAMKDFANAVVAGSEASLQPLVQAAPVLNAVTDMVKSNKTKVAENVINATKTGEEAMVLAAELVNHGRADEVLIALKAVKGTKKKEPEKKPEPALAK